MVALRGDFSFDALSPDGRLLYLIHYLSRRDPTRYEVRAYDVPAGRLLPAPIVDPREADERMRGLPITRVASADGRWHYTLYDGAGSHPFIHALDTVGRTAVCIDLDGIAGRQDLYDLRLGLRGRRGLAVLAAGEPLARGGPRDVPRAAARGDGGGGDGAGAGGSDLAAPRARLPAGRGRRGGARVVRRRAGGRSRPTRAPDRDRATSPDRGTSADVSLV